MLCGQWSAFTSEVIGLEIRGFDKVPPESQLDRKSVALTFGADKSAGASASCGRKNVCPISATLGEFSGSAAQLTTQLAVFSGGYYLRFGSGGPALSSQFGKIYHAGLWADALGFVKTLLFLADLQIMQIGKIVFLSVSRRFLKRDGLNYQTSKITPLILNKTGGF
jgi:hypothetical protein